MIQFNFIPQKGVRGEPNSLGIGRLVIHDNEAFFFEGKDETAKSRTLGMLKHPEIIFISSDGIMLKGYEQCGFNTFGQNKFKYQEWYCSSQ